MNKAYQIQLSTLRNRIPIGLKQAISLLEETNGDIERSEEILKEGALKIIVSKTGIKKDIAIAHLVKNNFDINSTLASINEQLYTLTERILQRYSDKKDALLRIANAVEQTEELKGNFSLDFQQLQFSGLENTVACFLAVNEWLNYEDYEGLDVAIYFHLDIVTDYIAMKLALPQVADTLRRTKIIHAEQYPQQRAKLEIEGGISATPEFKKQEAIYKDQKLLLIDALYEFVQKNIGKFP